MKMSPWGDVHHETEYAPGIVFVDTARHGGFILSKERLAEMPEQYRKRRATYCPLNAYEEDCEASLVVLSWPDLFTREQVEAAREVVAAGWTKGVTE